MTQTFLVLPAVTARTTAPGRRKTPKGKGYDLEARPRPGKYDHLAMLRRRIAGATWAQIAAEFGYGGDPDQLRQYCLNSRAAESLKPSEVARLGLASEDLPVGRLKKTAV